MNVYLGIDAGGTSMTAAAVDERGELVAVHRRRGVNTFAAPGREPSLAGELSAAIEAVRRDADGAPVGGIVVGLAGSVARPAAGEEVGNVVAGLGIDVPPLVVNDAETMFATGSTSPDGYVLAAGTGALAAAIRQHRIAWRADGHGWLLGDAGSAVWIGLAAVRCALAALEGRSAPSSLSGDIARLLGELAGHPCPPEPMAIVDTVHQLPPAALGRIAPLVDLHARAGDAGSQRILQDAASELSRTLGAVVRERDDLPIVLGGSVVNANATIRGSLERLVRQQWPAAAPLSVVSNGAAGAALWARREAGHAYDAAILDQVRNQVDISALDPEQRN